MSDDEKEANKNNINLVHPDNHQIYKHLLALREFHRKLKSVKTCLWLNKVLSSLKKHPLPIRSADDASKLSGFGDHTTKFISSVIGKYGGFKEESIVPREYIEYVYDRIRLFITKNEFDVVKDEDFDESKIYKPPNHSNAWTFLLIMGLYTNKYNYSCMTLLEVSDFYIELSKDVPQCKLTNWSFLKTLIAKGLINFILPGQSQPSANDYCHKSRDRYTFSLTPYGRKCAEPIVATFDYPILFTNISETLSSNLNTPKVKKDFVEPSPKSDHVSEKLDDIDNLKCKHTPKVVKDSSIRSKFFSLLKDTSVQDEDDTIVQWSGIRETVSAHNTPVHSGDEADVNNRSVTPRRSYNLSSCPSRGSPLYPTPIERDASQRSARDDSIPGTPSEVKKGAPRKRRLSLVQGETKIRKLGRKRKISEKPEADEQILRIQNVADAMFDQFVNDPINSSSPFKNITYFNYIRAGTTRNETTTPDNCIKRLKIYNLKDEPSNMDHTTSNNESEANVSASPDDYLQPLKSRLKHKLGIDIFEEGVKYEIITVVDKRELHDSDNRYHRKLLSVFEEAGKKIAFKQLPLGDVVWILRIIEDGADNFNDAYMLDWILERKTTIDLISSVSDGRYEDQKIRLLNLEGFKRVIYLFEDSDTAAFTSRIATLGTRCINPNAITSAKIHTQLITGFNTVHTNNMTHSVSALLSLHYNIECLMEEHVRNYCLTNAVGLRLWLGSNFMKFSKWERRNRKYAQMTYFELFGKQLRAIPGCSAETTETILSIWPTPFLFSQALTEMTLNDINIVFNEVKPQTKFRKRPKLLANVYKLCHELFAGCGTPS